LELTKSAMPTTVTAAGQTITYTFTVTNTGNTTVSALGLHEVSFSGTGTPLPTPPCALSPATLLPGDTATCTAPAYTVTQDDIDAGSIANVANATGTGPTGPVTSPDNTATVPVPRTQSLAEVKSAVTNNTADTSVVTAAGQTITYTFTVTNTGNTTISALGLHEVSFSGTGTPLPTPPCALSPATLFPGDTATCTAPAYTVTQDDIDAGSIVNVANVTGTGPTGPVTSPDSTADVPATRTQSLELVKSAVTDNTGDTDAVSAAGQTITYTFKVTNTGNTTVSALDLHEVSFSGTGTALPNPPCTLAPASVAPGDTATCTALAYTVTQADIDAGSIANVANATGTGPTGTVTSPDDTATVPVSSAPAISVLKTASPTSFSAVSQTITYIYVLKNTGNVTLNPVSLNDDKLGAVTNCTPALGSLAPAATTTCMATHVTTQADVNAGSITNVATATGQPPTGPPVMDSSTITVSGPGKPGMSLVKSANPQMFTTAGQTITYTFKVSNIGAQPLANIQITDALSGLSAPVCPATELAVGATMTCTATYTTTTADMLRGTLTNTATATANSPNGDPDPATSTAMIPAVVSTPGTSTPGTAAPAAPVSPITPTHVQVTG
jgi:uncharacterized repeat protein (TIGR01451 family)